ncbi:orotate phosphoribosyltransferase [Lutispora sp.]|uniref:orotate phosphoribosyltransferase n=1 Tax=Lutispora sp. TaxID=2828727 RepID=UPI002B1F8659|nr:orotate phosphoribosyltransferase [Lutispora sp.]MEA4962045.1 orotate phosphoribosyltransferase [Lutispora sp.]
MNNHEINEILIKCGVLLEGHFLLTSGKHSNKYLQCARLFQFPEQSESISRVLAEKMKKYDADMVVGPAIGGIILAYEVARQLGLKALFAERENGVMTLRRGFEIEKGKKVIVVEDVVTTGGSVKEVIKLVEDLGGIVAAVGSVIDRSGERAEFNRPFDSVLKMDVDTYDAENCPLCKLGSTPYKPGSRKFK